MTVFLIHFCVDYEGQSFRGVYSTREKAEARIADLVAQESSTFVRDGDIWEACAISTGGSMSIVPKGAWFRCGHHYELTEVIVE